MPQGMRSADHSGADGPRASEVCQFTESTCTQMRVGYPQTPSSSHGCNWVNFSYTHGSASPGEEVPSGGEALAAPTNIHPMSLCISKIFATIAWDRVSGATGYEINIYEGAEHSGESQIVQASTGNTFSLHRLEAGTTYYLAIRAVKDGAGQTVCCEWVDYSYRHMGHF